MDHPEKRSRIDLQEMAVQELRKGREHMAELSSLLRATRWPQDDHRSELAGVCLRGITRAFEVGIYLVMKSIDGSAASDPCLERGSSDCGAGASDGGAAPRRRRPNLPTLREQKRNISYSKTIVTDSPFAGDHQWRKYGEKKIRNFKNPRCYYRCVHGHCNAKLQIQQNDDSDNQLPAMYQVTHNNEHTCKANALPLASVQQAMLLAAPSGGSHIISFESGESAAPSSRNTNFAVHDSQTSTGDHTSSSSTVNQSSPSHRRRIIPTPTPDDAFCTFPPPPSPPGPFYGHDASVYI